jgi:hypothetical protein
MLVNINRPPYNQRALVKLVMIVLLASVSVLPLVLRWSWPTGAPTGPIDKASHDFGNLPLQFELNAGQSVPSVAFLTHLPGSVVYFTSSGVVMSLESGGKPSVRENMSRTSVARATSPALYNTVELRFLEANPAPKIESGSSLQGKVNYLRGNDPGQWLTNLPTYASVTYRDLYKGIDLSYAGTGTTLKGTYTVAAGADPTHIHWHYGGAGTVSVDTSGNLNIHVGGSETESQGMLTEQAPVAWQVIDGARVAVDAHYSVSADGTIGIVLGAYSRIYPLTIDPTFIYSTYLGGSGNDRGTSIAVDPSGNIYVAGDTSSTNFPLMNPYQPTNHGSSDIFFSKFNPSGSALVYSTYLGGGGSDFPQSIKVDGSGNVYLTGFTDSTNFPLMNPYQPTYGGGAADAFVTKMDSTGSALIFSTYLGGGGGDYGESMVLDSTGNIYLSGETHSGNFPLASPIQPFLRGFADAFITKLNSAGSALVFSTYLGGNGGEGAYGVGIDGSGNVYVDGATTSFDFPTLNPIQPSFGGGPYDAFVTKLNAAGTSLVYSTYLGGSNNDVGRTLAVDSLGAVYFNGYTNSTNYPVVNAIQPANGGGWDMFISKVNSSGTGLAYSTYLGGSNDEGGATQFGIAVDGQGAAYVIGETQSTNFPTANPIQPSNAGGLDAFVSKLNPTGSALVYSTYLGGSGNDSGWSIALDTANNAFVTGYTASLDFPVTNPFQPASAGGTDAFIAKINDLPLPPTLTATNTPTNAPTNTRTNTPTTSPTRTPTNTPTNTRTPTFTPTSTPTNTATNTPTISPTRTPTNTQTNTATSTPTNTATPCPINFTDVQSSDYFYTPVVYLYCHGVISGYNDNTFRPYNNTTRGQLTKIVVIGFGLPTFIPASPTFRDVPADYPFYMYIETAVHNNVVSGYSCGSGCLEFRPGNNVTRGQLSKIVVIAAHWTVREPSIPTFQDVPVDHTFYTFIETAYCHGIISGYSCGVNCLEFRPGNNATRGQISKIVYEAIAGGRACS